MSKKMKINEGEVPQYYVENSHPAIISPEEWEMVQNEMAVRKSRGKHRKSLSPFSAKFVCGDCGGYFGSIVWHSNDKYRRTIWQCNSKFKGDIKCRTPHLYEEMIKQLFLEAVSELKSERPQLIETCQTLLDEFANVESIEIRIAELTNETDCILELMKKLIDGNASGKLSITEYTTRYDNLSDRFDKAKEEQSRLCSEKVTKAFQADVIESFMLEIKTLTDLPITYSERLWSALVDKVIVYHDNRLKFVFKNGKKIEKII